MGCTFDQTRKRWRKRVGEKTFEIIGEEIIKLIEEMKNEDFKKRPSIDKILEKLIFYCEEKNYSDSIDIIPFLKLNKTFIQTPFNEKLFIINKKTKK